MYIYKQNERYLVSTLLPNFPDFAFKDESEKRLLYARDFSPDVAKIAFFLDKATLFMGFCFINV